MVTEETWRHFCYSALVLLQRRLTTHTEAVLSSGIRSPRQLKRTEKAHNTSTQRTNTPATTNHNHWNIFPCVQGSHSKHLTNSCTHDLLLRRPPRHSHRATVASLDYSISVDLWSKNSRNHESRAVGESVRFIWRLFTCCLILLPIHFGSFHTLLVCSRPKIAMVWNKMDQNLVSPEALV